MLYQAITAAIRPSPYKRVKLDSDISIGIASHGRSAAVVEKALACLFSGVRGDYELILVDNNSQDDTLKIFVESRREHSNLKVFSFPTDHEYCESVNTILSHSTGRYVFFVSNDILATPAYFGELIACLNSNSAYGIARGCSNFVDCGLQPHNLLNPSYKFESHTELFQFAKAISRINKNRSPVDDPILTGDAFAVSRRAIDLIGGFDTQFVGYFGDIDYAIRCRAAGLRTVVTARAFAYHNHGANFDLLDSKEAERRVKRRFELVRAAYQKFLTKYSIDEIRVPDELGPLSIEELLRAQEFAGSRIRDRADSWYVRPHDYSQYRVSI